jgi:putative restriction endonuclease
VDSHEILDRFSRLKTYSRGDRRAPHKPLLTLLALQRFSLGQTKIPYPDLESDLLSLLKTYAPPVKNRHQPELPYWHLQTDGIWEVAGAESLARQSSGFPRKGALNASEGGFTEDVLSALKSDNELTRKLVGLLLEEHFPHSIHEDLLAQIGLLDEIAVRENHPNYEIKKRRDPAFRASVLRAYEHQCAVTGFRAALGGSYFGCEAAHVQWHAYDGPDTVANGICLEPTVHKLLDAGAWTLSDDRRILVSKDFTGSDTAVGRLRERHGKPLGPPLEGEPMVGIEFIKWHRESKLGGVFRQPAMKV